MSVGRVAANREVCMGAGLCGQIAPAYFDVIDGLVQVGIELVAATDVDDIEEAVDACPTQAIVFQDDRLVG